MALTKEELQSAKQHIIEVSRELYDIGLLVRTWGNVSCRIDEDHFLITPTGIRYQDLTPEMIVAVDINDLSYESSFAPSSEKAVHAACYKVRKDVKFIIHTHQVYASCAGTLGLKKIVTYFDDADIIIPVAPYALPGSAKLATNIYNTVKKYSDTNGIIMSNHGAICFGKNSREAMYEAEKLEVACNNFLIDVCKTDMHHGVEVGFNSHKEEGVIVYDISDTPERVKMIHEEIYRRRPDVKYIIHNKSEAVMTVSRRASHMRPLFDDFAQLIGYNVKIPSNEYGKDGQNFHNIKRNVNAVFVLNDGAYCVGSNEDDALAVADVLDKGCIAYNAVMRHGEGHYLSLLECYRNNRYYRKTYSKLAELAEKE
jgi:L-fuculose-phosphate aldolase